MFLDIVSDNLSATATRRANLCDVKSPLENILPRVKSQVPVVTLDQTFVGKRLNTALAKDAVTLVSGTSSHHCHNTY